MNLIVLLQVQSPVSAHEAADEFVKMDPLGIGMAIVAMCIVFTVLAVTYITFKYFTKVYRMDFRKKRNKDGTIAEKVKKEDVSAEVTAAIAMALHLYSSQLHDMDSLTLTINKVSRIYSPWSSKIYSLRQLPR